MPDVTRNNCVSNDDENSPQNEFAWGTAAIAKIIGRTERQTFHLLGAGKLKTPKKVGGIWCANRAALRRELGAA
jgi:hypothetical protein